MFFSFYYSLYYLLFYLLNFDAEAEATALVPPVATADILPIAPANPAPAPLITALADVLVKDIVWYAQTTPKDFRFYFSFLFF
ncbi:hypothetical protein [Apibacter adventoris]|uniref:hypothetical protein n=1 Tax=Apibacter adventoris TaxID=1679466 RepID=UPI000CF695AF|nr:hypothetical protein [Apibacter adventoris]PQL93563.1 hypothetical protein C4S76_07920 [Apibacter adventoris]